MQVNSKLKWSLPSEDLRDPLISLSSSQVTEENITQQFDSSIFEFSFGLKNEK